MKIHQQDGQSLVEYLIVVALIAVATISVVRVVGQNVSVQYANIAKALGDSDGQQIKSGKLDASMYRKKDLSNFLRGAASDHSGSAEAGNDSNGPVGSE